MRGTTQNPREPLRLLIDKGQTFPKTHDLAALEDLCVQAGVLLGMEPDRFDVLSSYAVRVRYPGDDPTPDEAREAVDIAKTVRRLSRRLLGPK